MSDSVYALVSNNIVDLIEIKLPTDIELYAHRIVGYSNGDSFEYDWDNIDYEKPQSEWPKFYNAPEKCLSNNYVVSNLAVIDATIELTDTTTEGATMSRDLLTMDWLTNHKFVFGETITSPWKLSKDNDLNLWFEILEEGVAIENVTEDAEISVWFEGDELVTKGDMMLFNVNGQLVMYGVDRINVVGLPIGVYMVKTATGMTKVILGR